jgi:hypothetical protein
MLLPKFEIPTESLTHMAIYPSILPSAALMASKLIPWITHPPLQGRAGRPYPSHSATLGTISVIPVSISKTDEFTPFQSYLAAIDILLDS